MPKYTPNTPQTPSTAPLPPQGPSTAPIPPPNPSSSLRPATSFPPFLQTTISRLASRIITAYPPHERSHVILDIMSRQGVVWGSAVAQEMGRQVANAQGTHPAGADEGEGGAGGQGARNSSTQNCTENPETAPTAGESGSSMPAHPPRQRARQADRRYAPYARAIAPARSRIRSRTPAQRGVVSSADEHAAGNAIPHANANKELLAGCDPVQEQWVRCGRGSGRSGGRRGGRRCGGD